jgi:hypothetical protein
MGMSINLNIELTEDELEELRIAMFTHIQNLEVFRPDISDERLLALQSLTEKFKDILK